MPLNLYTVPQVWLRRWEVTGPDQTTAILIGYLRIGKEKFVLEYIKQIIVKIELSLERPIRHPSAALEHVDSLV
jgi:hypothetical protein